ncbi:hypothetical protein CDAR_204331 [Caerostris darwini]|uniref:Uncharacterized protein n=1 Tax=Caerostris darwini TaxID=1538125 RepID=A0AAV4UTH2_9ARAC|nr:hypothetical protein CDAR_204331 [Caerostris darwini]
MDIFNLKEKTLKSTRISQLRNKASTNIQFSRVITLLRDLTLEDSTNSMKSLSRKNNKAIINTSQTRGQLCRRSQRIEGFYLKEEGIDTSEEPGEKKKEKKDSGKKKERKINK